MVDSSTVYTCTYIYIYKNICVYVDRERERERSGGLFHRYCFVCTNLVSNTYVSFDQFVMLQHAGFIHLRHSRGL